MKHFCKRLTAFLTVLLLTTGVFETLAKPIVTYAADLTLKVHYHRPDDNYSNWDLWLWEDGKDGAAYAFADEGGEKVATMVVTPGTPKVGFIVRIPDWSAKDVAEDQFIDISEVVSGTVHIYIESGVKGYDKKYGDDAVVGVKLLSAKYSEDRVINIQLSGKPEGKASSLFTVKGADGDIVIISVAEKANNTYTLVINRDLDRLKAYTVTFDGTDYKLSIPSIYSTEQFEKDFTYTGDDLGATWSKEKTSFRLWAPTAEKAYVNLYRAGDGLLAFLERKEMKSDVNGTWIYDLPGDNSGTYYTYTVVIGGEEIEANDPYARTTGVNGNRAMIMDLSSVDPEGWENDKDPNADLGMNDIIIYELHVRDLSTSSDAGISHKGKYLGLIETGTKTKDGMATGLDHIKELGVTHVHILPFYDFGSVDESGQGAQFNWGYDPVNYNVPEGSYSTDAYHGEVRVREVKEMVKGLHDNGISVVMDVVYNHVYNASEFCFNKLVPGYFSRIDDDGKYSSGSGCGNDTASERSMVKKYIVDSVNYWADEYHIDGFRFDLVGLLDTETINEIIETVHAKHPNVKFYGEGWTMSTELTKEGYELATQTNSSMVEGFAFFSDNIRDALKGSVFSTTSQGYVSGQTGLAEQMKNLFKAVSPWTVNPAQTINYASCHDNNTLIDRITSSTPDATRAEQIRMNDLAAAIYLSSEGVPFMQAGEEMLRSKVKSDGTFDSNSYASSDLVNQLKWSELSQKEYKETFEYYKGLIAFRKAHPALRMSDAGMVQANITELAGAPSEVVAMKINGKVNGEESDGIIVIFNPTNEKVKIDLPEGKWNICVQGNKAGTDTIKTVSKSVTVEGISAMFLVNDEKNAKNGAMVWFIAGGALILIVAGVFVALKLKK